MADLNDAHTAAQAAWPRIKLDAAAFAEHVRRLWPEGLPVDAATADLYLAAAALAGDSEAIRELSLLLDELTRVHAARLGLTEAARKDLAADVLRRLLVADGGPAAALAAYRGRGPLRAYLGVALVHLARDEHRGRARLQESDTDQLDRLLRSTMGPETMVVRGALGAVIKKALQAAMVALPHRDRALLQLAYVQGLSTVQLAKVYGLNQSTASRWLSAARERLWEAAAATLRTEWPDLDEAEIRRLSREWAGQIDLSLSRLLTV